MAETYSLAGESSRTIATPGGPTVIVNNIPARQPWVARSFLKLVLFGSILANFALVGLYLKYYPGAAQNEEFKQGDRFASDKIAVIRVNGMILTESVAAPKRELKSAAEDDNVKAVVLHVNSPGGTIEGSDELFKAIEEFKAKTGRPIVVSMQGLATSGAYYISMPADEIFADRSCITGSIGVITQLFNVEKLCTTYGIKAETIKSGKMKDSGSPFREMNADERKEWQKMVDAMYGQFLAVILKHRAQKVGGEDKLRKIADGRIYMADEAKSLGLIDQIGYFDDALSAARKRANLGDKVRVVTYSRPVGITELIGLTGPDGGGAKAAVNWSTLLDRLTPRVYLLPNWVLPAH